MRLTEKKHNYYTGKDKWQMKANVDLNYVFELEQKLGQLEDIEEELGIDLTTLFKALKDGAYFKDFFGGEKYKPATRCIHNVLGGYAFVIEPKAFYFKDYGKTWALTKEELE